MGRRPEQRSPRDGALSERVKELECLYGIAQASAGPDLAVPEVLERVVALLPAALRYPLRAYACIRFDGQSFVGGAGAPDPSVRLSAPIRVRGRRRGEVAVGYAGAPAPSPETVFLSEERRLLAEVARQLGLVAERIESRKEQEALREQLWHAERLITLGQLASGVAHELNEPLGSALGFAQLLAKNPSLPPGALDDLRRIEAAALHARSIIAKLMLFSRQSAPRLAVVDLNALARDGVELLKWRCEDRGIRVCYRLAARLPPVTADEGQVRQVVVNLAANAIHALADGGRITVTTARRRGGVVLAVADTGAGIPPDILPRVFDPFFTTKDVGQGTGLGLSIAHGIVTAHGGKIGIESEVGKGTCVRVRLPVGRAAPEAEPARRAARHAR